MGVKSQENQGTLMATRTGGSKEEFSFGAFEGSMALLTPPFQISGLQNREELAFWANCPFVAPGKQHRTSHPVLQVTPPAHFGPYL